MMAIYWFMKAMYADQFQSLINDVKRKKVNEDNGKHRNVSYIYIYANYQSL